MIDTDHIYNESTIAELRTRAMDSLLPIDLFQILLQNQDDILDTADLMVVTSGGDLSLPETQTARAKLAEILEDATMVVGAVKTYLNIGTLDPSYQPQWHEDVDWLPRDSATYGLPGSAKKKCISGYVLAVETQNSPYVAYRYGNHVPDNIQELIELCNAHRHNTTSWHWEDGVLGRRGIQRARAMYMTAARLNLLLDVAQTSLGCTAEIYTEMVTSPATLRDQLPTVIRVLRGIVPVTPSETM